MEYRITVPRDWVDDGACIEFELPRNLACAGCGGGGCDACDRAGAVSTRGRKEPAELVQVTLPQSTDEAPPSSGVRTIVLRVPEQGGLAPEPDLPRGNLLLRVRVGAEADSNVTRLGAERLPSLVPPPALPPGLAPWVKLLAAAVALYLLVLLGLRLTGRG